MNELLAKMIEIVDKNKRNSRFFIILISVVILLLVFVPHIYLVIEEKNVLEKEVNLLSAISQIDYEAIKSNEILSAKYYQLVEQVCNEQSSSLNVLFKTDTTSQEKAFKILSGIAPGVLCLILSIIFCIADKDDDKSYFFVFVVITLVIMLVGALLNYAVMTFKLTIINYTAVPLLILIILCLYIFGDDKKTSRNKSDGELDSEIEQ